MKKNRAVILVHLKPHFVISCFLVELTQTRKQKKIKIKQHLNQ